MAALTWLQGGTLTMARLPANGGILGRDPNVTVHIRSDDRTVSRQHARIDYLNRPSGFVVTDLGSRNGVYVNDRRIDAPTLLQPGDRIAFGAQSNAVFRFEAD